MDQQFVSRVERPRARTSLPQAGELVLAVRRRRRGGRPGEALPRLLAISLLVPVTLDPSTVAVRVRRGRLHVPPLDVPHQALLLRERTAAVDPAALISRREAIVHRSRAICNVTYARENVNTRNWSRDYVCPKIATCIRIVDLARILTVPKVYIGKSVFARMPEIFGAHLGFRH